MYNQMFDWTINDYSNTTSTTRLAGASVTLTVKELYVDRGGGAVPLGGGVTPSQRRRVLVEDAHHDGKQAVGVVRPGPAHRRHAQLAVDALSGAEQHASIKPTWQVDRKHESGRFTKYVQLVQTDRQADVRMERSSLPSPPFPHPFPPPSLLCSLPPPLPPPHLQWQLKRRRWQLSQPSDARRLAVPKVDVDDVDVPVEPDGRRGGSAVPAAVAAELRRAQLAARRHEACRAKVRRVHVHLPTTQAAPVSSGKFSENKLFHWKN